MTPHFLITNDGGLRDAGLSVMDLRSGEILRAWASKNPEQKRQHNPAWSSAGIQALSELEGHFPEAFSAPGWAWFLGETPRLHEDRKRTDLEDRLNPNTLLQTTGASAGVGTALAVRGVCPTAYQFGVESDVWTRGKNKVARQRASRGLFGKDYISWDELQPKEQAVITGPLPASRLHHVLDSIDMAHWFRVFWRQAQLRSGELVLPERASKAKAKQRAQKTLAALATPNTNSYGNRLRQQGLLPKGLGAPKRSGR